MANSQSPTGPSKLKFVIATLLALSVMVFILRMHGRRWWCVCRQITPFSFDAWGPHNSQHLFDPYSLTHLLHGIFFCGMLKLCFPKLTLLWRYACAIMLECGWEILENSPFVIERYRSTTASLGYTGDTIVNSVGDVFSCAMGFWLARCIGIWRSVVLYVFVELVLLALIRDNLTLNVIMLIHPFEGIRNWQMGN